MWSDQVQRLADADDGRNHSHHSDPGSLACRFVDVVMRHEDVEDITNDLHCFALQKLRTTLHIQRLSLVFPLQEDHSDLCQVPQDSEHVLQQIGPHAAGIVGCNCILANDFQLSQKDAVVKEKE